jgi:hypothetical protein
VSEPEPEHCTNVNKPLCSAPSDPSWLSAEVKSSLFELFAAKVALVRATVIFSGVVCVRAVMGLQSISNRLIAELSVGVVWCGGFLNLMEKIVGHLCSSQLFVMGVYSLILRVLQVLPERKPLCAAWWQFPDSSQQSATSVCTTYA